ncbi:MAG: hypothetical protein IIV05_05470 [Ruminococcus sp.]|nr:hypothetical protein [Ruminococcus sp.]
MDKYTELLKDIAKLIAETERENFLLKYDLEKAQEKISAAEEKIKSREAEIESANERISDLTAANAIMMMTEEGKADA